MHYFTIFTSSEPGLKRGGFVGFCGDFTFLGSSVPALGLLGVAMILKFLQRYNIIKVILQVM
jgi:hypothetical protein